MNLSTRSQVPLIDSLKATEDVGRRGLLSAIDKSVFAGLGHAAAVLASRAINDHQAAHAAVKA